MRSLQSFTQMDAVTAVAATDTLAGAPGLCIATISADQQVQAGPVLGVTERQEQSGTRFSLCCQLLMEWSRFAVSTLTWSAVVTSKQKPFLSPAARFQEQLGALRVFRLGAQPDKHLPLFCSDHLKAENQ